MLFNIFTTSSPAKLAAATNNREGSQPRRASPPPAPISKPSKLQGIFQSLRRFVAYPKNAHSRQPQGAPTHPLEESNNIPGFATSSKPPYAIVTAINSTQLTPPLSVAATWVSYKSPLAASGSPLLASDLAMARKKIAELESTPDDLHVEAFQGALKRLELVDASDQLRIRPTLGKCIISFIERLNADTRRDSGRLWSSSWFGFERITAGLEPQRTGSAWQEPSDVSEGEETSSSEESGEGSRASGCSCSSSWFEFGRITAGSEPQRVGSMWKEPSDVSEGEATCSDSESGERSRASAHASASFQWSNEGSARANGGSGSLSPSPSAEYSLRRMPRGRQGGRMYAMRVPSAYGSSTDEDDFMDFLRRSRVDGGFDLMSSLEVPATPHRLSQVPPLAS